MAIPTYLLLIIYSLLKVKAEKETSLIAWINMLKKLDVSVNLWICMNCLKIIQSHHVFTSGKKWFSCPSQQFMLRNCHLVLWFQPDLNYILIYLNVTSIRALFKSNNYIETVVIYICSVQVYWKFKHCYLYFSL